MSFFFRQGNWVKAREVRRLRSGSLLQRQETAAGRSKRDKTACGAWGTAARHMPRTRHLTLPDLNPSTGHWLGSSDFTGIKMLPATWCMCLLHVWL